jgi:hypothetical protein
VRKLSPFFFYLAVILAAATSSCSLRLSLFHTRHCSKILTAAPLLYANQSLRFLSSNGKNCGEKGQG